MLIGVLQFEISIDGAESLKDKRRVVQSLKSKLHHEHQVSIAEVAKLDDHQRAILALALVNTDVPYTQSVLDRILDKLQQTPGFELIDHKKEILTGH